MDASLGSAMGRLGLDVNDFTSGIDRAAAKANQFQDRVNFGEAVARDLQQVGVGVAAMGGIVTAGFGKAISTAAEFEFGVNAIQAVLTPQQWEQYGKAIEDTALRLGQDYPVSALGAASAMEELAKQGISAENIIAGAGEAVVLLANATGTDLTRSAEIASVAMNQFGYSGEDMIQVADILTNAANASSLSVDDLGYALGYVGNSAANLSYDLDDTSTAIAILSDRGIQASRAGTGLRMMLQRLAAPTTQGAKLMDELGLSAGGVNSVIDEQTGQMRPLQDVIHRVARATADMNEVERAGYLNKMFGIQGGEAMLALLLSEEEAAKGARRSWSDYNAEINATGTAQQAALIRMEGLTGAIELFKGAMDTLMVRVGTVFIPLFEKVVRELADVVDWFANLPTPILTVVSVLGALAGVVALVVGAFMIASPVILASVMAFQRLMAVQKMVGIFSALRGAVQATVPAFSLSNAKALVHANTLKSSSSIVTSFTGVLRGLLRAISPIAGAVMIGIAAWKAWESNFLGIRTAIEAVGRVLADFGRYLKTVLTTGDAFNGWLKSLPGPLAAFASGIGKVLSPLGAFIDAFRSIGGGGKGQSTRFDITANMAVTGDDKVIEWVENPDAFDGTGFDYMVRIKNDDGSVDEFGQIMESYTDENDPNLVHMKVKTDDGEFWTTYDDINDTFTEFEPTVKIDADTSGLDSKTATIFERIDAGLVGFQNKMNSMGLGAWTDGLVNVFRAVNSAIGGTIGYVGDLWDYFQRLQIGPTALSPMQALSVVLNKVKEDFPALAGAIDGVIATFKFFGQVLNVIGAVMNWLNPLWHALGVAVGALGVSLSGIGGVMLAVRVGMFALSTVLSSLAGGFRLIMSVANALLGPFIRIASTVLRVLNVTKLLRAAMIGLRVVMSLIAGHPIVAIILALAAAAIYAYKNFEPFRKAVDKVAKAIKKFVTEDVVDFVEDLVDAVKDGYNAFMDWVRPIASATAALARLAGSSIVSFFVGLWDAIKKAASAVGEFLSNFAPLQNAIDGVMKVVNGLKDAFSSLMDGDIKGFLSGLGDAFMGILQVVGNLMIALPALILEGFKAIDWGAVGSALRDGVTAAWDAVKNFFSSIDWGALWDGLQDAGSAIISKLGDLGSALMGWIRSAAGSIDWGALWDGIKDVGSTIVGKLGDLAGSVLGWIREAASRIDWGELLSNAKDIVTGLSSKLGDLGAWAIKWVSDAASKIDWGELLSTAKDIVTGLSGKLGDLGAWAIKWVSDAASKIDWGNLLSAAKDIVTGLSGKLGDLGAWAIKWVTDAGGKIDWKALLSKASDIVTGLSKKLGDLGKWVLKWISDAVPSADDWKALIGNIADVTGDILKGLGDIGGALTGWLEDGLAAVQAVWDKRPTWLGGSGGGDSGGGGEYDIGFDGKSLGEQMNKKLVEAVNNLSGDSLAIAVSDWIGRGLDKGVKDIEAGISASFRTALDTAVVNQINKFSGDSVGTALSGWMGKAATKMSGTLSGPAMEIARSVDTAIKVAMTTGMSGASLAESLSAWINKAASSIGSAGAEGIGLSVARSIDTAVNAGIGALSGTSLSVGIGAWIGRAASSIGSQGATGIGLGVARSIDTAVTTGLAGLSGASLGAAISSWIGRSMTSVASLMATIGTSFATLLDAQFGIGITGLSGASLGTQISGWVGRSMSTVSTSLTAIATGFATMLDTQIGTAIAGLSAEALGTQLSGWAARAFAHAATAIAPAITAFVSSIDTQLSSVLGTALVNSETAFRTYGLNTQTIMTSWKNGITSSVNSMTNHINSKVPSTMSDVESKLRTAALNMETKMTGWKNSITSSVNTAMNDVEVKIRTGMNNAYNTVRQNTSDMEGRMRQAAAEMTSQAASAGDGVAREIREGMAQATAAIGASASGWAGIISRYEGAMYEAGRSVGYAAGDGVADGLEASAGRIRTAASNIISEVDRAMRAKAQISSPSKMTMWIAKMLGEGLWRTLEGFKSTMRSVAEDLIGAIQRGLQPGSGMGEGLVNAVSSMARNAANAGAEAMRSEMAQIGSIERLITDMLSSPADRLSMMGAGGAAGVPAAASNVIYVQPDPETARPVQVFALKSEEYARLLADAERGGSFARQWSKKNAVSQYVSER